ncbi:hypothetical protein FOA52_012026 [Chlamydomonas sp. UWO 241]|nr:hypothetical protein FOA52_012026 [Chlamydomonas sp. UWO 241]
MQHHDALPSASSITHHLLVAFSILAILGPFSYGAGLLTRRLKLPQITGYLASGMLVGPHALGLLSTAAVHRLSFLESACLAVIGLAAGAELDLGQLARGGTGRQVLFITLGLCTATWAGCAALLVALFTSERFGPSLLQGANRAQAAAAATLGATLMMARSPASAIAVLKEVDSRGPFCTLVMAVVVAKDVLVILAYSINVEVVGSAMLGGTGGIGALLEPLAGVAAAGVIGAAAGRALTALLSPSTQLPSWAVWFGLGGVGAAAAPGARGHRSSARAACVVLAAAAATFHLAEAVGAEPLLACVAMGIAAVNPQAFQFAAAPGPTPGSTLSSADGGECGEGSEKEKGGGHPGNDHGLHSLLQSVMSVSNVAFFALAGASLKLSALRDTLGPALLIVAVRLACVWAGAWAGCVAGGASMEACRNMWLAMVTQAGVAMGLARLVGTRFPSWGPPFQSLMMSVILVNLLVGPPLFGLALSRAGESTSSAAILTDMTSHPAPATEQAQHDEAA